MKGNADTKKDLIKGVVTLVLAPIVLIRWDRGKDGRPTTKGISEDAANLADTIVEEVGQRWPSFFVNNF